MLLTHDVGDSSNEHKLRSDLFECAFNGTCTCVPVKKFNDFGGEENGIKDHEVDLQHMSNHS